PGIDVRWGKDPVTGIITLTIIGAIFTVVNGWVRPLLRLVALPLNLLTLGLFSFVVNAGLILLVAAVADLVVPGQGKPPLTLGGFPPTIAAEALVAALLASVAVGAAVGFLAAGMGVGGGFIMVPAMIYLLGMPTRVVIGTSLFQIIFVSAFSTVMHAYTSQSVDILLALVLIIGGVIGAQIGTTIGARLKAEQLRILLAILVLAVSFKIALDLLLEPSELYSVVSGVLP
ncbi:MAG: sulfite exporter TauE/SafE family protein, partial [Gemmobacter sp.]